MKEIKRLRSYLKFLAEGTKNHGKAAELLDDLDTIEAYIDALEIHQNDQQPYRELAAKMVLAAFNLTHHYRLQQIGRMSLTAFSLEKALLWLDMTEENIGIYNRLVERQTEIVKQYALDAVDEIIETQKGAAHGV
jgi:hypothetical protein